MKKNKRILIARLGMDAHWRGSIVVARALRDAGMEVIYISNQMPENIIEVTMQEDPDIIGLSSLSGNHMILALEVVKLLKEKSMEKTRVVLGGTIPPKDITKLKESGIAEIFATGTSLEKIVCYFARL